MRTLIIGCLAALGSAAAPAQAPNPHAAPGMVTTPIVKTMRTVSNQPFRVPRGPLEMVAVRVDIAAGASTPVHLHPWSRLVYVERGPIRVINHVTGKSHVFRSGEIIPEAVAQWHEGRAFAGPVRLVVIDLVPPGVNNTIMRK